MRVMVWVWVWVSRWEYEEAEKFEVLIEGSVERRMSSAETQ